MPYPPKLVPEVIEQVLERVARGGTVASIARDMDFHPSAWRQLCGKDEAVAVAYAQAKIDGQETLLEECLDIADRRPDMIVTVDEYGNETSKRIDSGHVAWSKNRVDTRLKVLAQMNPERFGAKAQQATTVNVNVVSNEQVARVAKEMRELRHAKAIDVL